MLGGCPGCTPLATDHSTPPPPAWPGSRGGRSSGVRLGIGAVLSPKTLPLLPGSPVRAPGRIPDSQGRPGVLGPLLTLEQWPLTSLCQVLSLMPVIPCDIPVVHFPTTRSRGRGEPTLRLTSVSFCPGDTRVLRPQRHPAWPGRGLPVLGNQVGPGSVSRGLRVCSTLSLHGWGWRRGVPALQPAVPHPAQQRAWVLGGQLRGLPL